MHSSRQVLKRCLMAVAITVAGLLAIQGTAQAAPTAAPQIVSNPANPNTTTTANDFTFTVGSGETSAVSPLHFYCRSYNTASPLAPTIGWQACGLSTDPQPLLKSYPIATNATYVFEVAARESASMADQGPIASFTWDLDIPSATEAPVLVGTPADPNTTTFNSKFDFEKSPSETVPVTRFECRYSQPSGWTNWSFCGNGNDLTTGTTTFAGLPNGANRAQFRAMSPGGYGQVAQYVWDQNLPAPTTPPNIEQQPANPNTASSSVFRSRIAVPDATLARGMQCSVDSGPWTSCNSGSNTTYYLRNGSHNYRVRATGPGGEGPIASATWTVAAPEVLTDAIDIDDIAATRWDGPTENGSAGNMQLGGMGSLSAGDVNGDGKRDLAIGYQKGSGGETQIIFSGAKALGSKTISNIGPKMGFKIVNPFGGMEAPGVGAIGDQNGDGLDDLFISSGGSGASSAYVVYGVDDGSEFPACADGSGRCIDPSTMTAGQGYELTPGTEIGAMGAADFDGDGIKDLALVEPNLSGDNFVTILKGGARTGTISLASRVGVDAIKILSPTGLGAQFGMMMDTLEDVNDDGKDEFSFLGGMFQGSGVYVVTGRSLEGVSAPIDLTTVEPEDGFYIALAPLGLPGVKNAGDMNGDGRDDLLVGYTGLAASTAGEVSVVYMPELPTSDPILAGIDMDSDGGYMFQPGGANAGIGMSLNSLGDIDGDGLGDQALSAVNTPVNGFDQSGAVYFVKGQQPGVDSPIGLGPEFTSDLGVVVASGKARMSQFGTILTRMGDLDDDGLPDYAISAPGEANNGLNTSGSVYIVPGKGLFARSVTGGSTVVNDTKATINGQVGTNGRTADYHFEYGTSEEFGSSTDSQSLPAGGAVGVNADLSGLAPNTTYHYRLVVKNELGFNRVGDSKTFTTDATAPAEGCAADSTLPGCPDYDRCAADSTQPGCKDYNYCKANAGKPECKAPEAKLSGLIVNVANTKVKRGKKTNAKATIVNTGTAATAGLKVCLSAPKKLVGGAKCVNVGSLGAGASRTVKFNLTANKKAKKGKKATLTFKATATGLGAKTAKAKITIK